MISKHILVVGGTRGSGLALVRMLSQQDQTVSVFGRRTLPELEHDLRGVRYWQLDLRDSQQLSAALNNVIETNGKLSSLVFFQRYRGTGDSWTGELETSLSVTRQMIERLVEEFRVDDDRSIVIVNSIASQLVTTEQPVGYHVAKAGLIQLARYYAVAFGPKGIRVNCVSPGSVLKDEAKAFYEDNPDLYKLYSQVTPLRRMGTPDEVAQVIMFLCSSQASFITGQNIIVDGGASLQWQEAVARQVTSLTQLPLTQTGEDRQK